MKPGHKNPSSKTAETNARQRVGSCSSPSETGRLLGWPSPLESGREKPGCDEPVVDEFPSVSVGGLVKPHCSQSASLDTGEFAVDVAFLIAVLDDVKGRETEKGGDDGGCKDDDRNRR